MTQGQDIEKALELLNTISGERLNLTEARALLFVGRVACDFEQVTLPNISDVALALDMSHSGASRLMSNLINRDIPLISTDKYRNKGRSEAYFITERGREALVRFVAGIGKQETD